MDFLTIMNQVLIIFMIIIIGYIAAKLGYISREVRRGLNDLLLNITLPAMVIATFDADLPASAVAGLGTVMAFAFLSHFLSAVLSFFLFRRYPARARSVLSSAAVFTNCGFIGFPIMESIYGPVGIFYASIYSLAFSLFVWTYGQILFNGAKDLKVMAKSLFNAGTLSVLIGLVLLLTPMKLPLAGAKVASLVGSMTTPLAMIVIGAMLAEVRLRDMFHGISVYYATLLRLAILPAATFLILHSLGLAPQITAICTVLNGLPAAGTIVIFADKFGGDSVLATRIVIITTALSIITIPLTVLLVS